MIRYFMLFMIVIAITSCTSVRYNEIAVVCQATRSGPATSPCSARNFVGFTQRQPIERKWPTYLRVTGSASASMAILRPELKNIVQLIPKESPTSIWQVAKRNNRKGSRFSSHIHPHAAYQRRITLLVPVAHACVMCNVRCLFDGMCDVF
jgi:hypothetical protein